MGYEVIFDGQAGGDREVLASGSETDEGVAIGGGSGSGGFGVRNRILIAKVSTDKGGGGGVGRGDPLTDISPKVVVLKGSDVGRARLHRKHVVIGFD